jgi:hypothetical protein
VPIAPGTKLGQYEVLDFLGQGAMGLVYRAYHSQLERTGAIKVLQAITPDPDTVTRFRHEAQAIARLRHPNIVDVYDFGEYLGVPYMIVEYVPGGSLASKMAQGSIDRPTMLKYLRGIAAGLDYAHGHGVVHRDVKPANVLLTAEDAPVLADFGLAKLLHGSSLKSMTGVTTGTPAYMAPEQVTAGKVGPAADRYSLATIAYEMLTGVIPFDGEGLMELLYAQVHRYPSPPSARHSELGAQVDAVIMRGLAKNPIDRWESCAAFVEALAAALDAEPVATAAPTTVITPPPVRPRPMKRPATTKRMAASPLPATVAVALPQPGANDAPAGRPVTPPSGNRRRLAIGGAAILILLLVLGVCAAVAQATTLTVDPDRVAPGGTVTITATHVPANQAGEIQLWSAVHTYRFRANANGVVAQDITVPLDTEPGAHIVKICWDSSCHKQAPLRVVSGVSETLPSAGPSFSPGSSPSASPTAGPGSTPAPRSTPTPASTPGSSPGPSPAPSPTPRPASSPTPSPQCPFTSPVLSETPNPVLAGSSVKVSGTNFKPGPVSLTYYAGSAAGVSAGTVTASASCSFSNATVKTALIGPLLTSRTDKVVACDSASRCAQVTFTAKTVL